MGTEQKRIICVEDVDKKTAWEIRNLYEKEGCQILALTPIAMHRLTQIGITRYSIPEDFCVWSETDGQRERFEALMNEIGSFMQPSYMSPAYFFITMLKGVFDPLIRTMMQMDRISAAIGPFDSILYICRKAEDVIDTELFFKGRSLYCQFIERLAVDFEVRFVGRQDGVLGEVKTWRDDPTIRHAYDFLRGFGWLPSWRSGRRFLFASPMPDRMRELRLRGYRIDVARMSVLFSDPISIDVRPVRDMLDRVFSYDVVNKALGFESQDKMALWYRAKELLEGRISYFLRIVYPGVLMFRDNFLAKYRNGSRRYAAVVFNRRNMLYQYGLLMAAKELGISTVYIRHGWDAYDNTICWWRKWQRFMPYDYYLPSTFREYEELAGRCDEDRLPMEVL